MHVVCCVVMYWPPVRLRTCTVPLASGAGGGVARVQCVAPSGQKGCLGVSGVRDIGLPRFKERAGGGCFVPHHFAGSVISKGCTHGGLVACYGFRTGSAAPRLSTYGDRWVAGCRFSASRCGLYQRYHDSDSCVACWDSNAPSLSWASAFGTMQLAPVACVYVV